MSMADIYNDGTYIDHNPTLGFEDAQYKFGYIKKLIERNWKEFSNKKKLSILDIGGGCGELGRLLCEYLIHQGMEITFTALDLSSKMLEVQKQTNPHISEYLNISAEDIDDRHFDITLLIDVIEHIPNYLAFTQKLKNFSKFVIFNIPIEKNLFDKMKNIYFKGQYYKWQEESLGHLHFFSYNDTKHYLRTNFSNFDCIYPQYANHVLASSSENYTKQLKSKLRKMELYISYFIGKYLKIIAPYIVQGSLFALAKCR